MSPPDRKGRFEIKFTAILSLGVVLRARTRSVPTGKGEDGICHTHPPQSCPHHCKGLFHVEQSRLCCQDVLQGLGARWGWQPGNSLDFCSPGAPMVRWLYLSGLVFAVLIPAGWQVAPEDLEDLSRYGAGWSRAVGAAYPSPFLWLSQLSLFQCSRLFCMNPNKLPPNSPQPRNGHSL